MVRKAWIGKLRGEKEGRGRSLRGEKVGRVAEIGKRRERVEVGSEKIKRYDSEGDEEEEKRRIKEWRKSSKRRI
jgi:hypothetical protein